MTKARVNPFNSALETGIRALAILVASYPNKHDLERLVKYDYLVVHSADVDGPPSLHPALPLRPAEMLVRRGLIESGLRLMMSRSLVRRDLLPTGFFYSAEDEAGAFLSSLHSEYIKNLISRAEWVSSTFDHISSKSLNELVAMRFSIGTTEFQPLKSYELRRSGNG